MEKAPNTRVLVGEFSVITNLRVDLRLKLYCQVLSRSHASLSWDQGRFFVQDTGSSNGTFVNNIRLSKCGEESKVWSL